MRKPKKYKHQKAVNACREAFEEVVDLPSREFLEWIVEQTQVGEKYGDDVVELIIWGACTFRSRFGKARRN
jgi:hypothetical protein